jgi:hypothetical protein
MGFEFSVLQNLKETTRRPASHGTQDLYPDFLKSSHGVARSTVSSIAILYNICAIASSTFFGQLSESLRFLRCQPFPEPAGRCVAREWAAASEHEKGSVSQDTSGIGTASAPSRKETSGDCGDRHYPQGRPERSRVARADIVEKLSE